MVADASPQPGIAPGIAQELIARAEALAPALRARTEKAEAERRLPDESVTELSDSGLLKVCTPVRFGGYEQPWDVLCRVSRALARGCGSQAWCANIYNDHCQLLGLFPLEAQDDVWGSGQPVRISASVAPESKAKRVSGGARLSGRPRYLSGVDHAHWVIAGGMIIEEGKPPQRAYFLVPKRDVTIVDDWHVVGLAGTGSKSVVVDDAFVPQHRILDGVHYEEGTGPGISVNAAAVYRMPRFDVAGTSFAAVALGIAETFLDDYLTYTRGRHGLAGPVAQQQGTQIGVGVSAAELIAAERLIFGAARDAMAVLERGERLTAEQRLRTRLSAAFGTQLCLAAVQRLFNAAGAQALFADSPMQRLMRDLYAVSAHRALTWDVCSSAYGAVRLARP
jgi:3-hydroxy-9,10-secoandrosta-1,3,5(10)-triene-9,17-dione monooxygenase